MTPANEQDCAQVGLLAQHVQAPTGETVVMLPDIKQGFVFLPGRGVVERSSAWVTRFRWLARAYERLPQTLAGSHFVAFATQSVMLTRFTRGWLIYHQS